jgi:hypothetical protein
MKANVGTIDQVARVLAGAVLVLLAMTGAVGVWGYVGLLVAMTGVVRFCPAYSLFGISTCRKPE